MFCKYCGAKLFDDNDKFCPYCGKNIKGENSNNVDSDYSDDNSHNNYEDNNYNGNYDNNYNSYSSNSNDSGSAGWLVLGLFFPIIGLILYFCFKNEMPQNAKMCLTGSLVSLGICAIPVLLIILLVVFLGVII